MYIVFRREEMKVYEWEHRYTFLHKSITEHNPTPMTPNAPGYTHISLLKIQALFGLQPNARPLCPVTRNCKLQEVKKTGREIKSVFTGERERDVVKLPQHCSV